MLGIAAAVSWQLFFGQPSGVRGSVSALFSGSLVDAGPASGPGNEQLDGGGADSPAQADIDSRTVQTVPSAPAADSSAAIAPATPVPQTLSIDNGVLPASGFQPTGDPGKTIYALPEEIGPPVLREAVAKGDPLALFEIGARYTDGRGVSADQAKAAVWYERAAEAGFAPAQYRLANFHERGVGVGRDLDKAIHWYRKAAEQGNANAMHNLAVIHAAGRTGISDFETAAKWFAKAAGIGVADSQFNLAILHAHGNGVDRDLEETYRWFAIAARTGDEDAAAKLDEVATALSPDQLASARARAEAWTPQTPVAEANSVSIPPEWQDVDAVPPYAGIVDSDTTELDMTKENMARTISDIQTILTRKGFDTGGIDGIMGSRTVKAITAFQKSVGLQPTGAVDEALVRELLALAG